MRLSVDLPAGRVLVSEVPDPLAACGRDLLRELEKPASELADGADVEVEVAWSTLRLRATGAQVFVEEPGYGRGPDQFNPWLTRTCRIVGKQRELLQALGVDADAVTASQYVWASYEAMESISVLGYRHDDTTPFTGWQIVSVATADPAKDEYGQYTVRELAARRPEWIVAMMLPAGWAFRYAGVTIIDAVSPQGDTHELLLSVDL